MNLGICKHEFRFTCRGYCRFTLKSHSRWNCLISSPDLELVPKTPTSHSFRLETSGDGDNRRTCHMTVYCFLLENVVYLLEYTKAVSLNRVQLLLNRNGRKDDGQQ